VLFGLAVPPDLLIEDFEGSTYGQWRVEGAAFGTGPARGTLPDQMEVSGFQGSGLVNGFVGGDGSVGTLTSPTFRIQRGYIRFLIGGGYDVERTAIQLIVDGKVVRRASGPNRKPGGSERLRPDGWDVREYRGRAARIRIVDAATGGWGHISVDHIVQTDRKPTLMLPNVSRTLTLQKRFLLLPIRNGAPKRTVTFDFGTGPMSINEIELADAKTDWWSAIDVSPFRGRQLKLTIDEAPSDANPLDQVRMVDEVSAYDEPLRGQLHFSARRGWINDPNGLCYFNGEYHLFFQHNPFGWSWGNMHWGHAISRDLIHWTELPTALFPDGSDGMFSGGAVVDSRNTSGLGESGKPPLVLFYTRAGKEFTQNLATSTDGRTFRKYEGNPILPELTPGNRDPKVIWHEPSRRWIMALYVERGGVHTVEFHASRNLREWQFLSRVDGLFECPEFFELPVEGSNDRKWVLTAANAEYLVGDFDGTTFRPDGPKRAGSLGRGYYAAQTFSDTPDGRRIEVGWFQTETKGMPFNNSMSVPSELSLVRTDDGIVLKRRPVRELLDFPSPRPEPVILGAQPTEYPAPVPSIVRMEVLSLEGTLHLELGGTPFRLRRDVLTVGDRDYPLAHVPQSGFTLLFVIDRNGIEVFVDGDFVPIPVGIDSNLGVGRVWVEGSARVRPPEVSSVRSIWPAR
jgi:hypothetical protein